MSFVSPWSLFDSGCDTGEAFVVAVSVVFSVGFTRSERPGVFSCGMMSGAVADCCVVVCSAAVPVVVEVSVSGEAAVVLFEMPEVFCSPWLSDVDCPFS